MLNDFTGADQVYIACGYTALRILRRRADRPGFAQLTGEQTLEMLNITRDGEVTLATIAFLLSPKKQTGKIRCVVFYHGASFV